MANKEKESMSKVTRNTRLTIGFLMSISFTILWALLFLMWALTLLGWIFGMDISESSSQRSATAALVWFVMTIVMALIMSAYDNGGS